MESRKCNRCKHFKFIDKFGRTHGKINRRCKSCVNEVQREYVANNPETVKETLHRSYMKHRKKRLAYGQAVRDRKKRERAEKNGK